ncbi:thiol-disulfide oxidoreductase DCC family protein [Pedobacter sp. SL55]|uniref:thiol-disulfide oxidoreductase DCC family protein n=1 Tax=Pedobacter sp. SL55 TaxID=2995161 RepID=UPI00226FB2CF|nr:DUF393 domain-containing protein [Pedobacter sp. SL55]WAC41520.1 DUF393 domain-containing protein [Pedobacter sp. SL55]
MMKAQPIVFFDGVCNLCNGAVQFIIKYDKLSIFKFASLQSDVAEIMLSPYGLDVSEFNSIVLLQNGKVYDKSSAVLHIARQLRYFSPLYFLIFIPKFARDWAYNLVARNRYKVWGKQETCMLPSGSLKARFIN